MPKNINNDNNNSIPVITWNPNTILTKKKEKLEKIEMIMQMRRDRPMKRKHKPTHN